ncbi:Vacuolar-sorting receptor 1 [Seminavis robusta]|uniref:Vacuolar-sorting receptor 1 n=1 Tax=Seminavis robusta TaxID=568900 RepID=A0A9N8HXH6_9STRA|nr:Vacuolar-sorting receptor 1 [Seminavis robusta]|eukprot:Sro2463_g328420.1 Vacuolar-sorting receptor 1 (574) ;mRNA; r:7825-9651
MTGPMAGPAACTSTMIRIPPNNVSSVSMIHRLTVCLLLLLLLFVNTVHANEGHVLVPYEETLESYVEYPTDNASQTLLLGQALAPAVTLELWSTTDDFLQPLFYLIKGIVRRLDKKLVVFSPRYLLVDGRDVGCRGVEDENSECRQNCTNHGRYCAAPTRPDDPSLAARISGADIVEETLRRLCVWVVYGKTGGRNQLHFWNYISDSGFSQCQEDSNKPFGKNCTYSIMNRLGIGTHFIERCMNHTHGLEADVDNPYLDEQLAGGKPLTVARIPVLKINEFWYSEAGAPSTGRIFRAICANFPQDEQPVACDFCKDCTDVRYCLWFLQCDGTTFAEYAASTLVGFPTQQNNPQDGPFPDQFTTTPVTKIPTAAPTAAQTTPQQQQENANSTHKERAKDALVQGILVGLAMSVLINVYFACRDWQAQLVWKEILKEGVKDATKNLPKDETFQKPPKRTPTPSNNTPSSSSSSTFMNKYMSESGDDDPFAAAAKKYLHKTPSSEDDEEEENPWDRYQEEMQNSFSPRGDNSGDDDDNNSEPGGVDPDDLLYEFSECSAKIIVEGKPTQLGPGTWV